MPNTLEYDRETWKRLEGVRKRKVQMDQDPMRKRTRAGMENGHKERGDDPEKVALLLGRASTGESGTGGMSDENHLGPDHTSNTVHRL